LKRNKVIFYLIGAIVGIVLYQIISASFSHPGKEQWVGKYEEIGYYRNENNTGPVVRLIAVKVLDRDEKWMRAFADSQPHSKYGRTHVFFFSNGIAGKIELNPTEPFFSEEFRPFLLAEYEKSPMGESRFLYIKP
jgi:hypothetical protein